MRRRWLWWIWIKSWFFHLFNPELARENRRLIRETRELRALAKRELRAGKGGPRRSA